MKALKILIISALVFVFLFVGVLVVRKKLAQPDKRSEAASKKINPVLKPEFQQAEALIKKTYPQAYQKLESNAQASTQEEVDKLTKKFDTIMDEVDQVTIKKILPLADKVKVDERKKDVVYAQEFRQVVSDLSSRRVDLNNPSQSQQSSAFYRQKVELLSNIQPPRAYYEFHQFWLMIFATKAYVFEELGRQPEPEKKYALVTLLSQMIEAEERMIKFIQAQ